MRKEIILAIFVGLSLGLVVAFGLWRVNSFLKPAPLTKNGSSPSPSPNSVLGLTIARPENESVISESPVGVSGITKPSSWVVISGESGDQIVQSESSGEFVGELELKAGINQIKIAAFDVKGASEEENFIVVFSTEFAKISENLGTPRPSANESDIREKVLKKVEEVLKNPKSYLGTVTEVSENTLQIKTASGEIKQAAINTENITVIQTGKTNKEIKFADIAIGDFIVAMGYRNGNGVLDTLRILITSPLAENPRKIFIGKVVAVGKKDADIKFLGKDESVKFTPIANSKIKVSDLEVDNTVIIVGETVKDSFQVRTLKVI